MVWRAVGGEVDSGGRPRIPHRTRAALDGNGCRQDALAYFAAERAGLVGRRLHGLKSHLKIKGKSDLIVITRGAGHTRSRAPSPDSGHRASGQRGRRTHWTGRHRRLLARLVAATKTARSMAGRPSRIYSRSPTTRAHTFSSSTTSATPKTRRGGCRSVSPQRSDRYVSLVKQPKKDGVVIWMVQKENEPLGGERLPPHKIKIHSHKTST